MGGLNFLCLFFIPLCFFFIPFFSKINHNLCRLHISYMWGNIMIPMYRLWFHGLYGLHPGGTIECLNHFTSQVETTLQKINDERKMCIILGDLNLDGLKINLNDNVKNFFDTVLEQNFIPTITVPTRITTDTDTAIDHIIVNEQLIKNTKSL